MKACLGLPLSIFLICVGLVGCETAGGGGQPAFAGYKSPYAGNSGVGISPALERDAIKSLRAYLQQLHGSDEFEIVDRRSLDEAPQFVIDGLGRLVAGSLHEVWTIKRAGRTEQLEFIMFSDGQRGNTVGFKKYNG